jgi:hypothetical protein
VDGNHLGGVGIVFVKRKRSGEAITKKISTTVYQIFTEAKLPGLHSPAAIGTELKRVRNVLAELAGLYKALGHIASGTSLTIVYDYKGIEAWLKGSWKARDPIVAEIVKACERIIADKSLKVRYRYQPAHQAQTTAYNDFAFYNGIADSLATQGANSKSY